MSALAEALAAIDAETSELEHRLGALAEGRRVLSALIDGDAPVVTPKATTAHPAVLVRPVGVRPPCPHRVVCSRLHAVEQTGPGGLGGSPVHDRQVAS